MAPDTQDSSDRIRPYEANPFYWQYKGKPTLLLGGSVEDNLFQIDGLEEHLDRLAAVGGNFVRCTMSARDPGNVHPFARDPESGLYDLERWSEDYWGRFARFLELTAERGIVPQVEFWATYDLYSRAAGWAVHPFNPANNVNYTAEESGLPEAIDYRQHRRIQPFFQTVPALRDLPLVRRYQEAFVRKLLSLSLPHDHVLYCIDNETNADPEWSRYWAAFVKQAAAREGRSVEVTEMWNMWDPTRGAVRDMRVQTDRPEFMERACVQVTLQNPDLYSFVEISNTNAQVGPAHYHAVLYVRRQLEARGTPKPINCDKIYGADPRAGYAGPPAEGERRFWRCLFAGVSAVRFHRPPSGLALTELARTHIRSVRMLTEELDLFRCRPRPDLVRDRMNWGTEAYCLAEPGRAYAVCFPQGGAVQLNCSPVQGRVRVRWLDVRGGRWADPQHAPAANDTWLTAPNGAFWVALVEPAPD
ncbi:MAG: DUF6298 domain-containing protein [Planctomycetota bacterium]